MNTKTINGVDINLDQIKTAGDLRAANFFGHLDSPALKNEEAIKALGLPEEAPAEEAPAEEAPAEEAPAEEAPAEEVKKKKK